MRISSSLLYDRAAQSMGGLTARADTLQTQIATGKRIVAPSNDAAGYRQLNTLKRAATDDVQNAANVQLAASLVTASDTALSAIETQLQRANELVVQGASDTLSADQKSAIATQLDAVLEDIVRLANATDSRGSPLFSGASEATPYTLNADGTVSYGGSGESSPIPIGGASIQATVSGERIFGGVATAAGTSDVFAIVKSVADSLRAGTGIGSGIADVQAALGAVTDARASAGARGARLDLETARLADIATAREEVRTGIEDVDVTQTITELQKTLTVLQATQASFTKLTSLSLFDYIR
ncbi:flagellar biosynthesis protein FlgL [Sphingomonas donggukensis]|uniref:Flagellin n=1 Tax=Sphingomonas donggukensis TaxID=2949093 RepID=A0ABY4TTC5_9SPHN|nr:flagellin [Sphingomonas donggukensis]URW75532.1 flagellar biosynthesis protein FlgL [Sphingomonas donggukensis]